MVLMPLQLTKGAAAAAAMQCWQLQLQHCYVQVTLEAVQQPSGDPAAAAAVATCKPHIDCFLTPQLLMLVLLPLLRQLLREFLHCCWCSRTVCHIAAVSSDSRATLMQLRLPNLAAAAAAAVRE
jgi:hypothetical protein